jgi:hypothetical protein
MERFGLGFWPEHGKIRGAGKFNDFYQPAASSPS